MKRTPVKSECMQAVGYSPRRQVLEIEFSSGAVGRYTQVPAEVHAELMGASSKGRFFAAHIRGRFAYQQTKAARKPVTTPAPKQAPKPATRSTMRQRADGDLLDDLVAIAVYLREQYGGELPHATALLAA